MSDSPNMTPPPSAYPPPMPPATPATGRPGPAGDTSKLLAALGYPIWIVALIAILIDPYKDEKFVKFHGYQALALGVAGWVIIFVIGFIPIVDLITPLLWLVLLVYQIYLAVQAYNGKYFEVPGVFGFVKTYIGE
jgi:uncharacterized membrane protein